MTQNATDGETGPKPGYVRVKNTHTARVAGVPPGKTAYVKEWIAEHYEVLLVPVAAKKAAAPARPNAADTIEAIKVSTDVEDLRRQATEDDRKTVREAAEFRLMELDEDEDEDEG